MFDSIDEYMSIHRVSVLRVILRSHHLIILACLALTAAESLFTTSSITSEGTAQLSRCHCAVCSPKSPPALSRSAASSRIHALSADPSLKPRAVQSSHARYVARGRVNRIGPPRRGPPRIGSPGRGDPPSTRVVSPPPLPSAAPPSAAPPSAAPPSAARATSSVSRFFSTSALAPRSHGEPSVYAARIPSVANVEP